MTVVQKAKRHAAHPLAKLLTHASPPRPIALVLSTATSTSRRARTRGPIEVPREPSAAPFHDWNARIHAECYRANAFARIHDRDGPHRGDRQQLRAPLVQLRPDAGALAAARTIRAVEGAAARRRRRAAARGSGAAAPSRRRTRTRSCRCARPRDRAHAARCGGCTTFERRFGRAAEGLWLPETAVSPATLETLIELGVRYTILAPEQIAAVRAAGRRRMDRRSTATRVDTGRAYCGAHRDGSGRRIAHRRVRRAAVARGRLRRDRPTAPRACWTRSQASAERSRVGGSRLVLCASDGELWGHHKKFADLTLAFATRVEAAAARDRGDEPRRPTWRATRRRGRRSSPTGPDGEGTAWSCAHGLGRWQRDCGCNMGGPDAGWNQRWRGPLRAGAGRRFATPRRAFYEDAAGELLRRSVGRARRLRRGRRRAAPRRATARWRRSRRRRWRAGGERRALTARRLLELQRATLLMYASCGWFFDDIAGLEGSLVIRMGAHALDLLRQVGRQAADAARCWTCWPRRRATAPEDGTGADVFRRVARDRVTVAHAVAGAALADGGGRRRASNVGWDVTLSPAEDRQERQPAARALTRHGRARATRARARSRAVAYAVEVSPARRAAGQGGARSG